MAELGHFDQSCEFSLRWLEPRAQRPLYPPRQRQYWFFLLFEKSRLNGPTSSVTILRRMLP